MQVIEAQELLNHYVNEQSWENHLYDLPDPKAGTAELLDWFVESPFLQAAYSQTRQIIFSHSVNSGNFSDEDYVGHFRGLVFDLISFGLTASQNPGKTLLSPFHTRKFLHEATQSGSKFNGILCDGTKIAQVLRYSSHDSDRIKRLHQQTDEFTQLQTKVPDLFAGSELVFRLLPWEKPQETRIPDEIQVNTLPISAHTLRKFASRQFTEFRPTNEKTKHYGDEVENPSLKELLTEINYQKSQRRVVPIWRHFTKANLFQTPKICIYIPHVPASQTHIPFS